MAWNTSGSIITQTGTDSTFIGTLSSESGITTVSYGNRTYIIVPTSRTLVVNGTVTHDTERECIVFQRGLSGDSQLPNLTISSGATYNFGAAKVTGSTTAFSDSVGWIFSQGTGGIWYNGGFAANSTSLNGVHVAVVGTLTFNGGRAQGRFNFTFRPGSVVNNTINAKWLVENQGQTAGQEYLTRIYGGTFNTSNLSYEGGSISLGVGLAPETITFDRINGGVGYWEQGDGGTFNGTTQVYNTLRNVTFEGNTVDVAIRERLIPPLNVVRETTGIRIQNSGNGSNINVNGGEISTNGRGHNGGYAWITKEIETDITSATGEDIQGRLFIRDTDNGNRTPTNPHTFADDSDDFTYTAVIDGNISSFSVTGGFAAGTLVSGSGDNEIVLGINNVFRPTTNNSTITSRAAANTGLWTIDSRSNDGVLGTDVFTAHFWSYENQYIVFEDDLAGEGVLTYQAFGVPDEQITRPRTGTNNVASFSTTVGNNLSYNLTNVDVLVNMDASDIYDVVKYRKETVTADIESPSAGSMHLVRTNGTNNYGNRILSLASSATLTGNHSNISTLDINNGTLGEGTYSANTLTQVSNTTDATITVLGAAATALVPTTGATHTRLSLTNTTGTFNVLGAGIFTGGTLNSISLLGAGPITCTDTVFAATDIGVTGNKVLTDTSGTPVILNSTGLTLVGNEWTSGSSISLTTGVLNLDGGSYTTALTGTITTARTWTWNNLTANSISFDISTLTGGGIITIETNNTVTLTEAQRWYNTLTTAQQARFTVVEPAVIEVVTLPAPANGRYGIKQTIGTTTTTAVTPRNVVSSTPITRSLSSDDFADGDTIEVSFKFDSNLTGSSNVVYQEQKVTHTFGSGSATLAIIPPVATASQTANAIASGATFVANGTNYDITSTNNSFTQFQAQGAAIEFGNTDAYFLAFFNNSGTAPLFRFADDSGVLWRNDVFTFRSGNLSNVNGVPTQAGGTADVVLPAQKIMTNWDNDGFVTTSARGTQNEVLGVPALSATLGTVAGAARLGIDTSSVSSTVTDIAQVAGWIVTGDSNVVPIDVDYDPTDPGNRYINAI